MRARALFGLLFVTALARADDRVHAPTTASPVVDPGPTTDAFSNALRLARMIHDDRTVAHLLMRRAAESDLGEREIAGVVAALESVGEPEAAVRFLQGRVERWPSKKVSALLELARLHERRGDPRASAKTYEALIAAAGASSVPVAQHVERARVLSRIGESEAALAALEPLIKIARPEDEDYWRDLATLAWELDHPDTALVALRVVWKQSYFSPAAATRLMALESERGSQEEALSVGLTEWQRTQDPSALFFVANLQAARGDWKSVQTTLAVMARAPAVFGKREDYWTLRGEASQRLGDDKGAIAAFQAVLVLNPTSSVARNAILWDAIERGDTQAMDRLVRDWGATSNPMLVDGYAVALHRLGRNKDAIAYFMRVLRGGTITPGGMFELADLLAETGYAELAIKARRAAMQLAEPAARSALRTKTPSLEELEALRLAVEMHARAATDVGEEWLHRYLRSSASQRFKDELELQIALDQGRFASATAIAERSTTDADARLRVALETGDAWRARALFGAANARERLRIAELVDEEPLLASSLRENLDNDPQGEDTSAWRRRLDRIHILHAPSVLAGGSFLYLNGLDVAGGDVSVAHDALHQRVTWLARARGMGAERSTGLTTRQRWAEVDATATMRFSARRAFTEIGAGVVGHTLGTAPRALVTHERVLFRDRLALGVDARGWDEVDDTPFLRVAGLKNALRATAHLELPRLYASAEIEGREDQTRDFQHLGAQIGASGEAGARLVSGRPEWTIGAQASAVYRVNVANVPSSVASIVRSAIDLLPTTYESALFVTRVGSATLLERERVDVATFPRWGCEGAIGGIFPSNALAALAQCSASFRVGRGWITALARYDLGFAGVESSNIAQFGLSFTDPL